MHICLAGEVRVELTSGEALDSKASGVTNFPTLLLFGTSDGIRTRLVFNHRQVESLMTRQLVFRSIVTVLSSCC